MLSTIARILAYLLLIPLNVVLGTACHEIVGHGLVGVACGGKIRQIVVTGIQLWPSLAWTGAPDRFGSCEVIDVEGALCTHLWILTGSLSTFAASIIALVLISARRWNTVARIFLLGVSFWWVDLLSYTLPSFGLRRYVLFGRRIAEPYDAAVDLGLPGPLFQTLVLVFCAAAAFLSVRSLVSAGRGPAFRPDSIRVDS